MKKKRFSVEQIVQRQRQQGLGKLITSSGGQRVVAVKNRLLHSKRWLTFDDFLIDYIGAAFGSSWGNKELKKPPARCAASACHMVRKGVRVSEDLHKGRE
jgi:hypothetical protein